MTLECIGGPATFTPGVVPKTPIALALAGAQREAKLEPRARNASLSSL